ncbi:formylglycine-generating enzyme family protein [Octadecabacter sp. G9-8]|uniref:Formylglycine-generating enzyme family protein n=1 Tax=Octadecabacter dasysiphoniae TaxID=2909341 RepID=A0ABS9CUP1_9RHOB|nr:formylglycine-generating enzyme family protein [Octadecabacter dasysiphoniae]MCF2870968.1 formylglycine-generating enzyme family protein [Octadecabacter dasysiphoniae]
MAQKPCCTPTRDGPPNVISDSIKPAVRTDLHVDAITIAAGKGLVGTNSPRIPNDGESPLRPTKIAAFRIGTTTVTNAQFKAFVDATGFVTEAEKFGWSFVFWAQVPNQTGPTHAVLDADWWRHMDGANWRDINGPDTMAQAWHPDHPVVQVSWNDAKAYCDWVGGRLPSEAEWEHAARGGQGDVPFPWGNAEPNDTDQTPCNIWQGHFPETNTARDGYVTTAPAQGFAPNAFGLYNLVGNVWEWTSDAYTIKSLKKDVRARLAQMKGYKLSKGGSFLCHRSYCERYRIAARSGSSPDSATTHHGFRVVWPA